MSTPTIPAAPHHIGWTHGRVSSVISESQNGQCHFVSSPKRLFGRIQRESTPAPSATSYQCMQDREEEEEEEQVPLLYQIQSHRLVTWVRWWHLTSRVLLIAFQRRYWGLLGNYLKLKEVLGKKSPHLARIRSLFGRGQGRLLPQLSDCSRK